MSLQVRKMCRELGKIAARTAKGHPSSPKHGTCRSRDPGSAVGMYLLSADIPIISPSPNCTNKIGHSTSSPTPAAQRSPHPRSGDMCGQTVLKRSTSIGIGTDNGGVIRRMRETWHTVSHEHD